MFIRDKIAEVTEKLILSDNLYTFAAKPGQTEKPEILIRGQAGILHKTKPDDVIIALSEASGRGRIDYEHRVLTPILFT